MEWFSDIWSVLTCAAEPQEKKGTGGVKSTRAFAGPTQPDTKPDGDALAGPNDSEVSFHKASSVIWLPPPGSALGLPTRFLLIRV